MIPEAIETIESRGRLRRLSPEAIETIDSRGACETIDARDDILHPAAKPQRKVKFDGGTRMVQATERKTFEQQKEFIAA